MAEKKKKPKGKRPKKVNIRFLERPKPGEVAADFEGRLIAECYEIMDQYIGRFHRHLDPARMILGWHYGWKPNRYAIMTLGQCRRASDYDRELRDFDFVILLNYQVWIGVSWTREQKEALIDHELKHADFQTDMETGEKKLDVRGRPVTAIRPHDIEEFSEIVGRHGTYHGALARFARSIMESKRVPLFAKGQARHEPPRQAAAVESPAAVPQPQPEPEPAGDQYPTHVELNGSDREFVKVVGDHLRESLDPNLFDVEVGVDSA